MITAEPHGLAIFYPSTPSHEETGLRRGSAVPCKAAVFASELEAVASLCRG
jgi:hypothetical protein